MKPTAPGSLSHIFAFAIYFSFAFIFRSIKPKIQKYLAAFYLFPIYLFNLLQLSPVHVPISRAIARKGLTTPLTRRVARYCYLCARAVYVVLLGSVTLVSYLGEIPTADVLHHPFLFREIPT